ncbi:SusC/RagA family TonB-linked outer membrane protein [Flavobacterium sp. N502540]|uniref:SusC/RagA family TonB-linked outer membrane protein n=1 Tax=Flavobacterium sp. N502540 TaxID=2986838 RepID=UPI0022259DF7|nr:TonB-dependent receptor [Flavobacterium sp. N502540]
MKLKFKWIFTLVVALSMQFSFAQERTVTGKVSDKTGVIPGVNVLVKGSKASTQTDFDGSYSVKAKTGDVLIFSYVGMNNKQVTVGSSNSLNVVLESEAQLMNEVVVVGYGVQKRKEVTGSISKIQGADIANLVTPSFEGVLAGRAAGVQVLTNTGIIGVAPKIRVRGVSTISGLTEPLVVVDGMPIVTGDVGGLAAANGLGDINPADIESFEVLKDGAATAIYGSRAANGVILITTKSGKKGALKVNFSTVMGVASVYKKYDVLQTPDFITISNEKRANLVPAVGPWAAGNQYNTDWQGAIFRNAPQLTTNLSFSGGSDKTKYFLSLGVTDQEGINLSNDMKRYSIRANIDQDINKWLSIGTNLNVVRTEYNGLSTATSALSGNIFNAIRQLPNTPIYDASNPTGYNMTAATVGQWDNLAPVGDNITNIVYVLKENKFTSTVNRVLANVFANAKITSDLSYRLQVSADNTNTGGFRYQNPIQGDGRNSNGTLVNDHTEYLRWNWQNIINYKKTFAENHNIGITAVAEYQKQRYQYFFGSGSNLLSEFYNKNLVTNSYATKDSGGSVTENGIISYLARANYNYKEKYFIQGSIRRDGLSKFGKDTRYNNFPGVSAGWTVSKENFMQPISNTLSEFKLRASYSEVGNTDILGGSNYPSKGLTISSPYGTLNGIGYSQFGNDLLQWETSAKTDFGIDLGFFNNRLNLTFDYYKNDINGIVLAAPVSPSLGIPFNTINSNIGSMLSDGYEFSANFKAVNNANFTWDVSANLTLAKNKVTGLYGGQDIVGGTSSDTNISPNLILRQGESLNSLYGYQYYGVNKANGNPVYYKADGTMVQTKLPGQTFAVYDPANPADVSKTGTLTTSDKVILGNTLPTYYGSFTSNMTYKNLDFGFMFRFSGGNKIFNYTRRELMNQNFNNNGTEILGRWQSVDNPGDGWTPRLYAGANNGVNFSGNATSRFVENGDFISLDNISLGYSLSKSLLDKIKVDSFRLFVQAQNVWLISDYKGINPEMETNGVDINTTPRSKVISMGINVSL